MEERKKNRKRDSNGKEIRKREGEIGKGKEKKGEWEGTELGNEEKENYERWKRKRKYHNRVEAIWVPCGHLLFLEETAVGGAKKGRKKGKRQVRSFGVRWVSQVTGGGRGEGRCHAIGVARTYLFFFLTFFSVRLTFYFIFTFRV